MNHIQTRWALFGAAGALLFASACNTDKLLEVNNPDEIATTTLDDPALLEVRLNGVVDNFNTAFVDNVIQYATFVTDEMVTGLNWEGHARMNERILAYDEGATDGMFSAISRTIRLADGLAVHIRGWAADDPEEDFDRELAESLIYAGYGTVLLAENFCQSVMSPDPDNPSDQVLSQLETFGVAVPYLTEALSAAQAAGRNDLVNLARTGLARAYLGLGEWDSAAQQASAVTGGFEYWIDYVDIAGGRNPLQGTSNGGNFTHGVHPRFMGAHPSFDGTGFTFRDQGIVAPQTDPRIQHMPNQTTGHNGLTPLYKFFQGLRYSQYTGNTIAPSSTECPNCTGTAAGDMPLLTGFDTDVLLADHLEAQHHYHEALAMRGGSDAAVLAFVNERRAAGNQPPVTLSGQALRQELRNQRARDLFMGGFRLPDLRRWTRFDEGNGPFAAGSYFPTGEHVNYPTWGVYDQWTCFPIPRSEYEGNPNLSPPLNPNVPPGI